MSSHTTELDLVRRSSVFRFVETASNNHSVVHHFGVLVTPYMVLLHESIDGKLLAVWHDPRKRYSWDGRYPQLEKVFPTMPLAVKTELCRLRPLLSRRFSQQGDELDLLAGLCTENIKGAESLFDNGEAEQSAPAARPRE